MINNIQAEKNYTISFLRVISMFFIVLCHISSWLNISFLALFFNYGVYIFFLISGFLYANKKIDNPSAWLISRLKKILLPYYLFAIPISIFYFYKNGFDLFEALKYLFCLQGINFITNSIPFSEIPPIGNLWFLTIILFCYLLTIIVKKIEKKFTPKLCVVAILLILFWTIPKIMTLLNIPNISLEYFVTYFIGYYIAKFNCKNTCRNFIIWGLLTFSSSIFLRLIAKHFISETYSSYYLIVVSATHLGLAISSYFICNFLVTRFAFLTKITTSNLWQNLDKLSYPIYITHYAFLNSITSVDNFGFSKLFSFIIFILLTLASSLLIYYIDKFIQNKLSKNLKA